MPGPFLSIFRAEGYPSKQEYVYRLGVEEIYLHHATMFQLSTLLLIVTCSGVQVHLTCLYNRLPLRTQVSIVLLKKNFVQFRAQLVYCAYFTLTHGMMFSMVSFMYEFTGVTHRPF